VNLTSKLALGTVQFGLNYGIANTTGQPDMLTAHAILDLAVSMNITELDTASAYGNSETILGQWSGRSSTRIVSKFSAVDSSDSIDVLMERELRSSLARLQAPNIYGYLLHNAAKVNDELWIRALTRLKTLNLVQKIGVSIYEPEQALIAVMRPEVDIIQIPYSMMDLRLEETDFFALAQRNGKEIWARSAFVQGLLFLDDAKVPCDLQAIIPLRQIAQKIAASHSFSLHHAAVLFSLSHPGIHRVLVGVDSVEQLSELASVIELQQSFDPCRLALLDALGGKVDSYLVSPHKWVKH